MVYKKHLIRNIVLFPRKLRNKNQSIYWIEETEVLVSNKKHTQRFPSKKHIIDNSNSSQDNYVDAAGINSVELVCYLLVYSLSTFYSLQKIYYNEFGAQGSEIHSRLRNFQKHTMQNA